MQLSVFCVDPRGRAGAIVSVHLTSFSSPYALATWRRHARGELAKIAGMRFAKPMSSLAGRASFGFGAGIPDPSRQLTFAVWESEEAFDEFCATALGRALLDEPGWSVLAMAHSTRGSFHGERPIAASATCDQCDSLAVLTLGRTAPTSLGRFLLHGARLTDQILTADGLITAASAGFPPTGNATFSIWDSLRHMARFAYRDGRSGHRATATATPAILREQLNARLIPLRVQGRPDARIAHNPERLIELATRLQRKAGRA